MLQEVYSNTIHYSSYIEVWVTSIDGWLANGIGLEKVTQKQIGLIIEVESWNSIINILCIQMAKRHMGNDKVQSKVARQLMKAWKSRKTILKLCTMAWNQANVWLKHLKSRQLQARKLISLKVKLLKAEMWVGLNHPNGRV